MLTDKNVLSSKNRKKFKLTMAKYLLHEIEKNQIFRCYLGVISHRLVTKLSQVAGVMCKVR